MARKAQVSLRLWVPYRETHRTKSRCRFWPGWTNYCQRGPSALAFGDCGVDRNSPPSWLASISLPEMRASRLTHARGRNFQEEKRNNPQSNAEQGWGHGHGRRTLEGTISRVIRCWILRLRQLHDEPRSGGNQSAHQRMINRRFNDRASCFAQRRLYCEGNAKKGDFLRLLLETANIRVPCFSRPRRPISRGL